MKGVLGAFGAMVLTPVEHVLGHAPIVVRGFKFNNCIAWALEGSDKSFPEIVYAHIPSVKAGWEPKRLIDLDVQEVKTLYELGLKVDWKIEYVEKVDAK